MTKSCIKLFDELTNVELYQIIMLREQVFVVEQNCPYLDCDGKDLDSLHLWIESQKIMSAYARLVRPTDANDCWSIGRVVVHPEFRKLGLGKQIMKEAINHLSNDIGASQIQISAQIYLLRFYNELGFNEFGSQYLEDNIPHIKMIWEKN